MTNSAQPEATGSRVNLSSLVSHSADTRTVRPRPVSIPLPGARPQEATSGMRLADLIPAAPPARPTQPNPTTGRSNLADLVANPAQVVPRTDTRMATPEDLAALGLSISAPTTAPSIPVEVAPAADQKLDLKNLAQRVIDDHLKTIPAGMKKHKHLLVAGGSAATGALLNTFGITHMTPEQQQLLLHADVIIGGVAGISVGVNRGIAKIESLPAYEARASQTVKHIVHRVREAAYWVFMATAPYSIGASAGLVWNRELLIHPANAVEPQPPKAQGEPPQEVQNSPLPPAVNNSGVQPPNVDSGNQGLGGNVLGENPPPAHTGATAPPGPHVNVPSGNDTNVGETPPIHSGGVPPPVPSSGNGSGTEGFPPKGDAGYIPPPAPTESLHLPTSVTLGGRGMWGAAENITDSLTKDLSQGAANIIKDAIKDELVVHFPGNYQAGQIIQIPHEINTAAGQHSFDMYHKITNLIQQVQNTQHVDTQTALDILYKNHALEQHLQSADLPKLLERATALMGGK